MRGAAPSNDDPRCPALAGQRFDLIDAPTRVDSAQIVPGHDGVPVTCHVKATIAPQVGVEVKLPASGWNGKYFMIGRGGYCRPVNMAECDNPLRKGYACAISDQGHKSGESDDIWASGSLQAKVDCGFRGNHVAAVASKAITRAYYRTPPRHAYFMGCSTGGRMALVEVQRFPQDFDGVIAGAPPVAKFANGIALAWNALAALDPQGKPLLTAADLQLLHKAALAQCDAKDGLKDGVIGAALSCHVDLRGLPLSPEKIEAIRRIYAGPTDSKGRALYDGAPLPGSELNWISTYLPSGDKPAVIHSSMTEMFRYLNDPIRPDSWSLSQLDWDRVSGEIGLAGAYNDANNPDLSRFRAAGGKLIVYHGLADQLVMPRSTVAYYDAVTRAMGGLAPTRTFARLFLIPGLNHCWGGDGATVIDQIAALEDWVERGKAPEVLTGARLKVVPANPYAPIALPLAPETIAFTRRTPAYPANARRGGS